MANIRIIRGLRKISLFKEMSDDELKVITKVAKKKNFKAGDIICNYGEKGGTLYLINNGSVQITLPLKRFVSREKTVSVLREGDYFGELSFFDEEVHSAKATAIEDAELLEINHDAYSQIVKENLELGLEMQKKIILKVANLVRGMNVRYSYRPFMA